MTDESAPTGPTVRSEVVDGVGVVTLDAPERRNAFDLPMCDEVAATLDALEADPTVGALVVTGAGSAFCAGADLSHLGGSHREGLLAVYEGFLRFARSPLPTIAAVNGPAVGAGMNLALACDVRLAGTSARFDTRFLQLGIHPGGGHTWMMQNIVGPQATAAMVLFGEVCDGAEAERIGLAWRCVPDDELLPAALAMAARAAAAPRELVERTKANVVRMPTIGHHEEAIERELYDQVWSVTQPAFADRLATLKSKISRTPGPPLMGLADDAEEVEIGLLVALQSSLASSDLPPVDVALDGSYPLTEIVLTAHGRQERHSIWLFDPEAPDDPTTLDIQFSLYRLATTAAWLADSPEPPSPN